MKYQLAPGGALRGEARMPGDKSISHRAVMLGAIAEGVTRVKGFLEGEDALATVAAFRALGVEIEGPFKGEDSREDGGELVIHGVGLHGLRPPQGELNMGNSGTSMRLLAGLLAGQPFDSVLTGDASLSRRPMGRIIDPLRQMGANIQSEAGGRPPLRIQGGARLKGIHYDMPIASAQVKSCLLLAGLYAEGRTSVTEPAPTRDHTERMLRAFGCSVERDANGVIGVQGGARLKGAAIEVPGDISSAAFFLVGASIAPGSDLTLTGIGLNPTRTGVIEILQAMGANIEITNRREVGGEPVGDVRVRHPQQRGGAPLQGIEIPVAAIPRAIDEFPALFIAAACAEGRTILRGAGELRVKESDRIGVMAEGLAQLGAKTQVLEDGIIIDGFGAEAAFSGGTVDSHRDHRIAMSFTLAALRAGVPIQITSAEAVATSFPGFAALAARLGLNIKEAP